VYDAGVTELVERVRAADAELVVLAKRIRVLGGLTWPEGTIAKFLEGWRAKSPRLPDVPTVRCDLRAERDGLDGIDERMGAHSLEAFVASTARSYSLAACMLDEAGRAPFTELSRAIYGTPRDLVPGATITHEEAAKRLLVTTDNLTAAGVIGEAELGLGAEDVAAKMRERFARFFGESAPEIEIDPDLASKAAAGATRIRLRAQTSFSVLDLHQLLHHEAYVHTATALNGRAQPVLASMGLGAPRTTLTQEGLATLSELVMGVMDIARLRRLALRIVAIQLALEGADFIDVFRCFLEAGQSEDESAHSAMRVFRGGDVRGRIVFTKDVVYLSGLVAAHTFLRKAIAENRPHLVRRVFAGRLTLGDVGRLDREFASGHVAEPKFVPEWARDLHRLSAYLAFSSIIHQIDLEQVDLGTLAG
jgi:uncharacterized protein (TIGR02421 family)